MKPDPKAFDSMYRFLDWTIAESGLHLFVAFAWFSVAVLVWVFTGGLRRKFPNQPHVRASIGIFIQPHTPPSPPPLIIIHECEPPDDGLD